MRHGLNLAYESQRVGTEYPISWRGANDQKAAAMLTWVAPEHLQRTFNVQSAIQNNDDRAGFTIRLLSPKVERGQSHRLGGAGPAKSHGFRVIEALSPIRGDPTSEPDSLACYGCYGFSA